jgi:hypothetical protein
VILTLEPVPVETGGPDEEGSLAFVDGRLAAVLVRLSEQHGERAGSWCIEAGFGPFDGPNHPIFADLDAARAWMLKRAGKPTGRSG